MNTYNVTVIDLYDTRPYILGPKVFDCKVWNKILSDLTYNKTNLKIWNNSPMTVLHQNEHNTERTFFNTLLQTYITCEWLLGIWRMLHIFYIRIIRVMSNGYSYLLLLVGVKIIIDQLPLLTHKSYICRTICFGSFFWYLAQADRNTICMIKQVSWCLDKIFKGKYQVCEIEIWRLSSPSRFEFNVAISNLELAASALQLGGLRASWKSRRRSPGGLKVWDHVV